jgi:hypothetical protein
VNEVFPSEARNAEIGRAANVALKKHVNLLDLGESKSELFLMVFDARLLLINYTPN